mmetsp:Transcript_95441/g.248534  ORF Transcript_95441/g.248534 Transcript_95441/m.248534 type:complete len:256 (-) Transcript_95441:540-1307(-)
MRRGRRRRGGTARGPAAVAPLLRGDPARGLGEGAPARRAQALPEARGPPEAGGQGEARGVPGVLHRLRVHLPHRRRLRAPARAARGHSVADERAELYQEPGSADARARVRHDDARRPLWCAGHAPAGAGDADLRFRGGQGQEGRHLPVLPGGLRPDGRPVPRGPRQPDDDVLGDEGRPEGPRLGRRPALGGRVPAELGRQGNTRRRRWRPPAGLHGRVHLGLVQGAGAPVRGRQGDEESPQVRRQFHQEVQRYHF